MVSAASMDSRGRTTHLVVPVADIRKSSRGLLQLRGLFSQPRLTQADEVMHKFAIH